MTTATNGKKVKVHTVYKNKEGIRVPGVTTALGILNKPALIYWAWDLGIQGTDYKTFRDDKADIGTLTHLMALSHEKGEKPDTDYFTQAQIDLAETCFLKYLDWRDRHKIKSIFLEKQSVSELFQYGGTLDHYCLLDGIKTLIDYKTGKAIYTEQFYQLAAYKQLLNEEGYKVDQCIILRLGRNEEEGFETKIMTDLSKQFEVFLSCLKIYQLKKEIKKIYG
jgi:hypothetical protein